MKQLFLILIPLYLIPYTSSAQQIHQAQGEHNFDVFTPQDGLVNSAVVRIFQDSRGYMWFGTTSGVSRFDGKNFKNFTEKDGLPNNAVYGITEDKNGNMIFGTSRGLAIYDGFAFKTYSMKDGLTHNHIWTVAADDDGSIWLGTEIGVDRFNEKNKEKMFESILLDTAKGQTRCINKDGNNNWYFGTISSIYKYSSGTLTIPNGLENVGSVHSITFDTNGNLYFGIWWGHLAKFDGAQVLSLYESNGTLALLTDKEGNIWAGSWDKGLFKYDPTNDGAGGKTFINITTKNGLSLNSIWSLCEDREGNIWIGTFGAGVCKYSGDRFVAFNEKYGIANNLVNGFGKDKNGKIWISSENGITQYVPDSSNQKNSGITNFTAINGKPIAKIMGMLIDRNTDDIFFPTYMGNMGCIYRNEMFYFEESLKAFCIYEDRNGNIWTGGDGYGINKLVNQKFQKNYSLKDAPTWAFNRTVCIYEDKDGNIWFCNLARGVNFLRGDTVVNFSNADGFTNNIVSAIIQDKKGIFWFGTSGNGVYKTLFQNGQFKIIDSLNTGNGLSSDQIAFLVFDASNNLWIGTGSGLNKFNYDESENSGKKIIQRYGKSEGFSGIECSGAVMMEENGMLWIGTSKGAYRYNPASDKTNNTEPLTSISKIKLFLEETDWTNIADSVQTFTGLPVNLQLPYNKNHLTFEFIGISLTVPEKVKYKWMLENFDAGWSPVSSKNEATYSSLPPGKYIFKAIAANNDGIWNSQPAVFSFEIIPPWWQRWWFRIFSFVIVVLAIWSFIKWRERNLKREKAILERKVSQRTEQLRKSNEQIKQEKEKVEASNLEITKQKEIIEAKNKDITDSIRYAENIQQAILTPIKEIKNALPGSFVLFKPKDIVSGDFYFFAKIKKEIILAACDSTGHGVPGAFMSMLGSQLLNEIVNDKSVTDAAEVLNQLRKGIIHAFGEAGATGGQKDGMDMALCVFNLKTNKLQYAGANNPLYIIHPVIPIPIHRERTPLDNATTKGEEPNSSINELTEIKPDLSAETSNHNCKLYEVKADKQPIGYTAGEQKPFTNHDIQLEKGDTIYMSSDGYQDQFGGPATGGKKFMRKQFRQLLLEIHAMSMEEQEKHLDKTIEEWKGDGEQMDDILVIGVRV